AQDHVERRRRRVERLLLLRHVAQAHVRAEAHAALARRDLSHDDAQQRGLPRAVRPEQRDALAVAQGGAGISEEPVQPVERVPDALERENLLPAARHLANVELQPPVTLWLLHPLVGRKVALQLLLPRERLLRDLLGVAARAGRSRRCRHLDALGLHLRPVDILLNAADLGLLVLPGTPLALALGG